MNKNRRFLIGGVIILAALSYMIYGGMQEAIVYFVTPSAPIRPSTTAPLPSVKRSGGTPLKNIGKVAVPSVKSKR